MQGGKSQTGYFVLAGDSAVGEGRVGCIAPIMWRSSRQRRVCRSTFGAETLALSDGTDAADYIRGFWHELYHAHDPRDGMLNGAFLHYVTDSKDLFDSLSKTGVPDCAEKRLILELVIMREFLSRARDSVHWTSTKQMISDALTKDMPGDYIRDRLSEGI